MFKLIIIVFGNWIVLESIKKEKEAKILYDIILIPFQYCVPNMPYKNS